MICFLLTITPGADTALILRSAISGGRNLYLPTILGICPGLLVHATMSSLGLSVILQQSVQLYSVVKIAGAAYLIFLGGRTLLEAWKVQQQEPLETIERAKRSTQ
jgi:threonine/homoserine/homoserine lactone efflux protein